MEHVWMCRCATDGPTKLGRDIRDTHGGITRRTHITNKIETRLEESNSYADVSLRDAGWRDWVGTVPVVLDQIAVNLQAGDQAMMVVLNLPREV